MSTTTTAASLPPANHAPSPRLLLPQSFANATPPPQILAQGAEALVFKTHFLTPSRPAVLKYRPPKTWRHPTLDARLTRHRILAEARILVKCRREGVDVPGVLALDWEGGKGVEAAAADVVNVEGEKRASEGKGEKRTVGEMEAEDGGGCDEKLTRIQGGAAHVDSAAVPSSQGVMSTSTVAETPTATSANLDRSQRQQDRQEQDTLQKVPRPNKHTGKTGGWMMVEWIPGGTVRNALNAWIKHGKEKGIPNDDEAWLKPVTELLARIGRAVAALHKIGVVHGDLTTSNLMLRSSNKEVDDRQDDTLSLEGNIVLIDFGLATTANQDEERAVDLYVLERAYGSTHPTIEERFEEVLKAYGDSYKGAKQVLRRLEDVRMRGRKKSMIG